MRRRTLLATAAASLATRGGMLARAAGTVEPPIRDEVPEVFERIRGMLAEAGIGTMPSTSTAHYLCAGTVSAEQRARVGRFCEALLAEAMRVFGRAGFAIRTPERRLTVVALGRREEYVRLARGRGVFRATNGFFNLETRAVFFPIQEQPGQSGRVDWGETLEAVGHEAMHQFCFGSGLLNPRGDFPGCVSEGLATLGELGSRESPRLLSSISLYRLKRMVQADRRAQGPLDEFFLRGKALSKGGGPEEDDLAYARAWLLVHTLMTEPDLLPKFRAYLKAIAVRTDDSHRLEDARTHLGDLSALEDRMTRVLHKLADRPPSRYDSLRRSSSGG